MKLKGRFMKTRTVVLSCLIGVVILFLGHEYSAAQPKDDAPDSHIGLVNIRVVFRDCKANIAYRDKAIAEQNTSSTETPDASNVAIVLQNVDTKAWLIILPIKGSVRASLLKK